MKKFLFALMALLLLFMASGCGNEKEKATDLPEMVEVELSISPETSKPNQSITFEAKVTQGKEKVEDADEVTFEIWRSKDENHEKIKINHAGNGIYRLEKSFQQEGTYYIISHVTARDMHNMPKKEFIVGTPSEPEDAKSEMNMNDHSHHDEEEAHDEH